MLRVLAALEAFLAKENLDKILTRNSKTDSAISTPRKLRLKNRESLTRLS
jgi:hypothetical protein